MTETRKIERLGIWVWWNPDMDRELVDEGLRLDIAKLAEVQGYEVDWDTFVTVEIDPTPEEFEAGLPPDGMVKLAAWARGYRP